MIMINNNKTMQYLILIPYFPSQLGWMLDWRQFNPLLFIKLSIGEIIHIDIDIKDDDK